MMGPLGSQLHPIGHRPADTQPVGSKKHAELALSISMAHMSIVSTLGLVQMTGSSIAWAANRAGYLLSLNLVKFYRNH